MCKIETILILIKQTLLHFKEIQFEMVKLIEDLKSFNKYEY